MFRGFKLYYWFYSVIFLRASLSSPLSFQTSAQIHFDKGLIETSPQNEVHISAVGKILSQFREKEDGDISNEGVLWLPIYAFFMVMIVDVSLMINGQAQAQHTLQDNNRLASSAHHTTEEAIEARATALLGHLSDDLTVQATIDADLGVISAVAAMRASDLMAIGTLPKFADIRITVGAWHMIES